MCNSTPDGKLLMTERRILCHFPQGFNTICPTQGETNTMMVMIKSNQDSTYKIVTALGLHRILTTTGPQSTLHNSNGRGHVETTITVPH